MLLRFFISLCVIWLFMVENFQWIAEAVEMPEISIGKVERWLCEVALRHGKKVRSLTYIFCNDGKILEVNRQYLNHDYFTDIITFDYCRGSLLRGDMYISLDTVGSNAETVGADFSRELLRVIVHGLLHLCGINDKGPGERERMEAEENEALQLFEEMK